MSRKLEKINNNLEKKVANIFRPSRRKPFKKVTLSELTRPTDYNENRMVHARLAFYHNDNYLPVKELIDEKYHKFFKTLYGLTPDRNKAGLKKYNQDLKEVFYNDIYQRVCNDPFLMNSLQIIADSQKRKREAEKTGTSTLYQEVITDKGLNHFESIIDEAFEIPGIVLSAFGESSKNFKKKIIGIKQKYKGLQTSDPHEQKLFAAVWKINEKQSEQGIKFSPYATFKKINDKKNYVDPQLIQPTKFTTTPFYNRYKQHRMRKQKLKK